MPTHMVIFRSAEGKPGFHQTDGLDEAIRFVEHLRNIEQVPDARVYKLAEVPLEVRTYFKVEVADEPTGFRSESVADVVPGSPSGATPPLAPPAPSPPTASVGATNLGVQAENPAVSASPIANGGSTARFGRFNRG